MKTNRFVSLILFLLLSLGFSPHYAHVLNKDTTPKSSSKRIAITIDDLPFVGEYRNFHLNMIIEALNQRHVTATGFIIANEVSKKNWKILRKFRDAGFGLGNHTLSHANLGKLDLAGCANEIESSDAILNSVLTQPKYFRYPYLSMGTGTKKNDILCLLAQKDYQVAPITIDSKDFSFNQRLFAVKERDRRAYLEELKPFYLEFIWQQTLKAEQNHRLAQAQILLIHANLLNAYVLGDIINMYQTNGYKIISLQKALATIKHPDQCSNSTPIRKKNVSEPVDNEIDTFVNWD